MTALSQSQATAHSASEATEGDTLGSASYENAAPHHKSYSVASLVKGPRAHSAHARGFTILHGSLAPAGCIISLNGFDDSRALGTARVFRTQEAAISAIESSEVRSGHICILHSGLDVRSIMKSLDDHGLGHIVVICEDRFEGTRLGPVISDINPPAAQGGPFGKVKDDDVIRIDIENRRIDVLSQASKNDQDGQNKTKQGPIKNKFAPTEKYAAILAAKS